MAETKLPPRPAPLAIFTYREKMQCAQREVNFRRYVYAKRVAAGKMKQADADKQIAIMESIAADYGVLADEEEKRGRLL